MRRLDCLSVYLQCDLEEIIHSIASEPDVFRRVGADGLRARRRMD
jgi:hypothetical protein